MAQYREEIVGNVSEFIRLVNSEKDSAEAVRQNADFLFRGQREDLPLLPRLARLRLKGSIQNVEKLMLKEFKRTSLPYIEFTPADDWDQLSLAQHFGLPTRLLDWTFSALIGLWFAVRRPPAKNNENHLKHGVVWVLMPELEDFRTENEAEHPLSVPRTRIFRPKVISKRISAQAGAFTVHRINPGGNVVRFETHRTYAEKLLKVIIPPQQFSTCRQQLHILGVNSSTVFPDLPGLCEHLEWRYSYQTDEKPPRKLVIKAQLPTPPDSSQKVVGRK